MVFSLFFNALPICRICLHEQAAAITLPMAYVRVPEMFVAASAVSYTRLGSPGGIKLCSPVVNIVVSVDTDNLILDYLGWAERI